MKEVCPKIKCTGCLACVNKCNHSAIHIVEDELGFRYPSINTLLCTDCGLCNSACPINNKVKFQQPLSAFVANAKWEDLQKSCTSGGLATILARYICGNGGIVYGCTGEDCSNVKHIRVDNLEELSKLKGSKYVQSDMGNVMKLIKQDLLANKQVFFVGTPCQVAGVYAFLGKAYENLYTADFVCHGVPSQKLLNDAILSYSINPSALYSVSFRSKTRPYETIYGLNLNEALSGKSILSRAFPKDNYITGFLQALYYRESCYSCLYTKISRCSDLTLGDYKDRNNIFKNLNAKNMLSMVLVNTSKGEVLFKGISSELQFAETSPVEFVSHNAQLRQPMPRHRNRDEFCELYQKIGFEKSGDELLKEDRKKIRKNLFYNGLRDLIYKIPLIKFFYKRLIHR